ncbi:G-box-binding factor 1 isoform X2 [Hevea brasiliensis]|uniref:G-box-binding factor 1 isoform X2 n=1 Tax=Hevea brasiliensis TaxID=3981 RepID=UPI000B783B27|nr:G-box-binding factor 1 isoform X2 [Hevea brasiliensis]
MGTGEESTPARPSKPAPSTQEIPTTPSYPDWSNSMQAYYGAGATPPFFASTVPSPTPHPYLWGSQTPNSAQTNTELEGKTADGKDRASAKKSKGTSAGKAGECVKAASGSGNDGSSQSAESGSNASSDASDENQQEYAAKKKGSFDQMLADATAQNNSAGASVPGKPVMSMPATNLNIGMDLWNASSAAAAPGAAKMRTNASGATSAIVPAVMPEQWIQDERELKRQKRKQSNRESARRSRLRKQAECEELQARVENLTNDNHNLKEELQRISGECEKLKSENDSIKEELTRLYGPDAVAKLEQSNHSSVVQSLGDEGNS